LPEGLQESAKLPEAIFTPSTKAEQGHDENITEDQVRDLIGAEQTALLRDTSLRLYTEAHNYARERDIIIADTKFEFGLDQNGQLMLVDEVLTPDSSRFWPADSYEPGAFTTVIRQAIRAGLSRDARLGQATARTGNSGRCRQGDD
jgi:phosphoribosylaminoimidazole-succinocarboxamide synthase